jgi:stage II sporulation protein D
MKKWSKEILRCGIIGVLVPAALLTAVVAATQPEEPPKESRPGIRVTLPVKQTSPTRPETILYLPVLQDDQVRQMALEEYLVGVILSEVPTEFCTEALKAQAVAARTYSLKSHQQGYKHDGAVCTTASCCQGYIAPADYLQRTGDEAGIAAVRQAVQSTKGQVLVYDEELILATYYDCSGGRTEDAAAVWGKVYPYLLSVESPGEDFAPHFTDSISMSTSQFQSTLGLMLTGAPEGWFSDIVYTSGGGVDTMRIGGILFSGTQLRSKLGLRSTAFTIAVNENSITITTHGYGHRVGLSQYGAQAMALSGSSYKEILEHYYPGSELEIYTFHQ